MKLSPETCRVKPLRRINAIVASCWIYFTIKSTRVNCAAYIKLAPECKILDTNVFADESIVQHVGCVYRLGVEENVPSEVSDLLGLLYRKV